MTVLFGLMSALAYGLSDFIGGLVGRRCSVWAVAVVVQATSTVSTAVPALLLGGSSSQADLAWAAAAGVGTGLGVGFLFRGLSDGRMAVVAPLSAVGAAVVPVLAGLVFGERPSWVQLIGIALALPGIWLVSGGADPPHQPGQVLKAAHSGVLDGIRAGLAFGVAFTLLAQLSDGAGLWPIALSQAISVLSVITLAVIVRQHWVSRSRSVWWAAAAGPLSTVAVLAFLAAARSGLLTVASVLAALYPATTVVLAMLVLGERVRPAQTAGLVLCGLTVAAVAAG